MKYALYWRWKDERDVDTDNFDNACTRDIAIKEMKSRGCMDYIAYEPIYKSGEHGARVTVIGKW